MIDLTMKELIEKGVSVIPSDEPARVMVGDEPAADLVPIDMYEMFVEAVEELEDIEEASNRLSEETVSYEEVLEKVKNNG